MVSSIIIVGGGLAGLTACLHLYQLLLGGLQVVIVEKEQRIGGNSMKATSGINAVGTNHQLQNGVLDDSIQSFIRDTLISGHGLNDKNLVEILAKESKNAVEWLESITGVNLKHVIRGGGHSHARTHRESPREDGKPVAVGYDLVSGMIRKVKETGASILTGTKVLKIIHHSDIPGLVKGIEIETAEGEKKCLSADFIVLTSGGYGANVDNILADVPSPQLDKLRRVYAAANMSSLIPTTNGPWATGDALNFDSNTKIAHTQLEQVQVHPTGLVDQLNPHSKTKILGPEALRSCGGILISPKSGNRFVDELSRRDEVTEAIIEHGSIGISDNFPPVFAFMVLDKAAVHNYGIASINFYRSKNLIKQFESVEKAFQWMKLPTELENFVETLKNGGISYSEELYVCIVTPSIHYTMGGLIMGSSGELYRANNNDECKNLSVEEYKAQNEPFINLFGAGEVTTGVHGGNRLVGNSLLECAVFGRICAKRISDSILKPKLHGLDSEKRIETRVQFCHQLKDGSKLLRLTLPNVNDIIENSDLDKILISQQLTDHHWVKLDTTKVSSRPGSFDLLVTREHPIWDWGINVTSPLYIKKKKID